MEETKFEQVVNKTIDNLKGFTYEQVTTILETVKGKIEKELILN